MAVSGNGWPVSPIQGDLGIETFTINGANFPVRGGKVRQLLEYVAIQVNNRVERANATYGCWGYSYRANVNSPGTWSNHASGTAIDYNATRHPNGVPTSATFTPAQIAEIHKILAEVGGAVRWGGDYNGTPDAMHFEIDVTPEQLDVVVIDPDALAAAGGGATPAGYGAPTLFDASTLPRLTEGSVSLPTLMNYGHGYAQWLFVPTQSGSVSIDGLLSHYSDPKVEAATPGGPSINLYLFPVSYGSDGSLIPRYADEVQATPWVGTEDQPARNTGQIVADVVAGQPYVVRATTTPDWPWIKAVVRIGSIAQVSEWITPPPVEAVITLRGPFQDGGPTNSLHFPEISGTGTPSDAYAADGPGWLLTGAIQRGPAFRGEYTIRTSPFGQAPWANSAGSAAMECAWRWARRYDGSQLWSTDDTKAWNGTVLPGDFSDDYFGKTTGAASCRVQSEIDQKQESTYGIDYPLGVIYRATPPLTDWDGEAHSAALFASLTIGNVVWEAYAGSLTVDFDSLRYDAGPSAWGGSWVGPDWWFTGTPAEGIRPEYMPDIFDGSPNSPTAEFEPELAKILKVEWALDEYVFLSGYNQAEGGHEARMAHPQEFRNGSGSVVNWYVQRIDPSENVEGVTDDDRIPAGQHPGGRWGPWGNDTWYGQAVGDGPAELSARSELLTSTSGGVGGTWRTLDSSYWSMANDREVPYEELRGEDIEDVLPGIRPSNPAQVRFIAMPRVMTSDSIPFIPPSGYGDEDNGLVLPDFLRGQSIALRVTFQPARYRIHYAAEIPDLTYSGSSAIAMNSESTGQVLY